MVTNDLQKAELLMDSLGFIKKFHNKTVVIKYGGHAMQDEAIKESVIKDIVLLKYIGMNPVIVHGGGPEISEMMATYGLKPKFIDGLRVTDEQTMTITEMVLTGKISPSIAAIFNANDVKSVSISGKDSKTIEAVQRSEELGLAGRVKCINPEYIQNLINEDYLPIVSPIGYGPNGQSLNINSDEAAWSLAVALKAHKMILITDVDGVYRDPKNPASLMNFMDVTEVNEAIADGTVSGGMIPKLECCLNAIEGGVDHCQIINGTLPHAIILELFTAEGIGTLVSATNGGH